MEIVDNFNDLPEHIVKNVLDHLDGKNLKNAMQVCKM